jgi:hypothetical protein
MAGNAAGMTRIYSALVSTGHAWQGIWVGRDRLIMDHPVTGVREITGCQGTLTVFSKSSRQGVITDIIRKNLFFGARLRATVQGNT